MNNFPYPKGSTWSKWDLQVQTILDDGYIPLSAYYMDIQKADPTKWGDYVATVGGEANALLFDSKAYLNDGQISMAERCTNHVRNFFAFLDTFKPGLECIGITDHNYFHEALLDSFIDYSRTSRCKIIPGVEINCQGIHMLLFFPGKLYGKDTFSAGIHAFLIKHNINTRNNPDGTLVTTSCDIKAVLSEVKKIGGIVIYPHCNSSNGLFQERTKTDRTHLADIFNHQKMNLLQSQQHSSSIALETYIQKNKALTTNFSCHISSDSRSLGDYGRADAQGNYLWVKADPTFEGLKQLCFEPQTRIFVGPQFPEQKKSYFVIDRVRFLDNTANANFSSNLVEINQNLTTIIGGKSTGKSLLLYYIAKTIDPVEVSNRLETTDSDSKYEFDQDPNFNFEVLWNDGQSTFLKTPPGTLKGESTKRKILYIPQRYLNTLSEANIKSKEALNEFVLGVLLQDPVVAAKYDEVIGEIKTILKGIPIAISDLISDRNEITRTEDELKQIGDEKGISTYIQTLQKQADEIKAKSGLTEEQLKHYEESVAKEKDIVSRISHLEEDKRTIKNLQLSLTREIDGIRKTINDSEPYLNVPEVKVEFNTEFKVIDTFAPAVTTAAANLITSVDAKIKTLTDELVSIKGVLAPLMAKVQLQSELQSKTDAIRKEQQKLNEIAIKTNAVKTKRVSYGKKTEVILNDYGLLIGKYELLRNEFKAFESKFGEISLGVHVSFQNEGFNTNVVKDYLNRNDLKRNIEEAEWGEEFIYKYDPTKHLSNVTTVFQGLLDGKINTVKGRTSKDAIEALFNDYFFLDFRIFYKQDSLDKMSPGKKGLVLLQLLINLSDEEWPILLDQPEDDLDNRSVYEDLVSFLKKKKSQRQIIIVTHNPNLVVGADAEETVVANQSGQEVGRENKQFRFEYISGALENTFTLESASESSILLQKGIREHVCEILEGGKEAFQKREQNYNFGA
jgi:hypothetical protein